MFVFFQNYLEVYSYNVSIVEVSRDSRDVSFKASRDYVYDRYIYKTNR